MFPLFLNAFSTAPLPIIGVRLDAEQITISALIISLWTRFRGIGIIEKSSDIFISLIVLFIAEIDLKPLSKRFLIIDFAKSPPPITRTSLFSGFSNISFTRLNDKPLTDNGFIPIFVSVLTFFVISKTFST